ncbi:MAG TPA: peptidoglycan recognition family protein [Patescibacteria group bacterium]|nr:peptidoglycan recognition family protein [Patescibacteria group bacterium]
MDEAGDNITGSHISRRDFLNMGVLGLASIATGKKLVNTINYLADALGDKVEESGINNKLHEVLKIVQENSKMIVNFSDKYGIPPEVLATVVSMEHLIILTGKTKKDGYAIGISESDSIKGFTDLIEKEIHPDKANIGLCQVNLQDAINFEDRLVGKDAFPDADKQKREQTTYERLESPWWNMVYFSEMLKKEAADTGKTITDKQAATQFIREKYNDDSHKLKIFNELLDVYSNFFQDKKPDEKFKRCSLEEAISVWNEYPEYSHLFRSVWPVEYFVVHHTAGKYHTESIITAEHIAKGFGDIGYNGIIGNGELTSDGKFYPGRSTKKEGAHTLSYNKKSIGVALVGDFNITEPTTLQLDSLRKAIIASSAIYEIDPFKVVGHRELNDTQCPGNNFTTDKFKRPVDVAAGKIV